MGTKNFSDLTTLNIGGPVGSFMEVFNEEELKKIKPPYLIIGGGSNILASDSGFDGLVVKNSIKGMRFLDGKVFVKTGEILWDLVNFTIEKGFFGMQKLSGIPGTVGGAICGNAGAYGQTISDYLIRVKVFDGKHKFWLSKKECVFKYRDSIFKTKNWVLLEAVFKLPRGNSDSLKREADEIVTLRLMKYRPGILCPGSFFKNVVASDLNPEQTSKIPVEKIVYGKITAGYLLEEVGARGEHLGKIKIANHHANLFMNEGQGKASDFYELAKKYKVKVKKRFGIDLEPEVRLVGFSEKL